MIHPSIRLRGLWLRGSSALLTRLPSRAFLRQPSESDPVFRQLMKEARGRTLVDEERCFMLFQFALSAARLQGDVAEVGVYRGGTARLLSRAVAPARKTVRLFDTFEGMPSTDPQRDRRRTGPERPWWLPTGQAVVVLESEAK